MHSNYLVLARKYRPMTISSLKGQEVLVTTLKNAFAVNRIAHAFLLSGIRGVGKTTTARILAKALNCTGPDGTGGITLDPCNECHNCATINNDTNLDVLEMDAASKTGIDDIRELIDTIKYKPLNSRYKVYIIDEIHMLSKSAFNALLKSLEEPPPYVKFIFATTELKKVPITVISRCQRFDLRRLSTPELQAHLAEICKRENITFEDNALLLIADAAEGSVRDSLSILDQAINCSNNHITEDTVIGLLGRGSAIDNYELFTYLTNNDHEQALLLFNKLYDNGVDILQIFESLLEICHLVSMVKTTVSAEVLTNWQHNSTSNPVCTKLFKLCLTETETTHVVRLAQSLTLNGLIVLWQILSKALEEIKISVFPKKAAEMIFLRITWVNEIATLPYLSQALKGKEYVSMPTESNLANTTISADTNTTIHRNSSAQPSAKAVSSITTTKPPLKNTPGENEHMTKDKSSSNPKKDVLEEILELFPDAQIINK